MEMILTDDYATSVHPSLPAAMLRFRVSLMRRWCALGALLYIYLCVHSSPSDLCNMRLNTFAATEAFKVSKRCAYNSFLFNEFSHMAALGE